MIVDVGLLPQRPIGLVAEEAKLAEQLGFGGVWLADSQSVFRDGFLALGLCAQRTATVLLGTAVTNPITRHPAVLACSFASLEELAPGRVRIGIGSGESSLYSIGLRPARLAQLEETTLVLRALVRGEPAHWQGHELRLAWPDRPIPIYLGASGPKTLELAGRLADGVIFQVGADPALVDYAVRHVELGVHQAGRSLADIEICMRLGCAVHRDPALAREQMKHYAAVAAKTVTRTVPTDQLPEELKAQLAELEKRYDYLEHADPAARHREAVTDAIVDSMAVAGNPEEVRAKLARLTGLGVNRFIVPITQPDPAAAMHLLAEAVSGLRA